MLGAIRPTGSGGGAVSTVFGRSGGVVAGVNDYSASQIAGLGGSAAILTVTPGSTQTLTAASTITANAGIIPITSTAPITLTSNPQVASGTNGQRITLVNIGSNAITLVNGNGLIIGQSFVVYGGKAIGLIYLSTYSSWVWDVNIPESLALTGIPTAPTAAYNAASIQVATTAQVFNHLYNHDFPGWRSFSLTSNWVDYGSGFPVPAIKRMGRDTVFFRGVVAVAATFAATITTIPADCRPSANINFTASTSVGTTQMALSSAGVLSCPTTLTTGQFLVLTACYSL